MTHGAAAVSLSAPTHRRRCADAQARMQIGER